MRAIEAKARHLLVMLAAVFEALLIVAVCWPA